MLCVENPPRTVSRGGCRQHTRGCKPTGQNRTGRLSLCRQCTPHIGPPRGSSKGEGPGGDGEDGDSRAPGVRAEPFNRRSSEAPPGPHCRLAQRPSRLHGLSSLPAGSPAGSGHPDPLSRLPVPPEGPWAALVSALPCCSTTAGRPPPASLRLPRRGAGSRFPWSSPAGCPAGRRSPTPPYLWAGFRYRGRRGARSRPPCCHAAAATAASPPRSVTS